MCTALGDKTCFQAACCLGKPEMCCLGRGVLSWKTKLPSFLSGLAGNTGALFPQKSEPPRCDSISSTVPMPLDVEESVPSTSLVPASPSHELVPAPAPAPATSLASGPPTPSPSRTLMSQCPSKGKKGPKWKPTLPVHEHHIDDINERYLKGCLETGAALYDFGDYVNKSESCAPDGPGLAKLEVPIALHLRVKSRFRPTCLKKGAIRFKARHPTLTIKQSSFPDKMWAKFIADRWRVILKHMRELSRNPKKKEYAISMCTHRQARNLQRLISMVSLDDCDSDVEMAEVALYFVLINHIYHKGMRVDIKAYHTPSLKADRSEWFWDRF